MSDLLVNLLKLPPVEPVLKKLEPSSVVVRRARPFELSPVRSFIDADFSLTWADEISVGFANKPVSVFLATSNREIVGFAGYECTARGFFGPMGVAKDFARQGIGRALLLTCLWALREMGYVYGIIGAAGPVGFYEEAAGAVIIPESSPGFYSDLLKS